VAESRLRSMKVRQILASLEGCQASAALGKGPMNPHAFVHAGLDTNDVAISMPSLARLIYALGVCLALSYTSAAGAQTAAPAAMPPGGCAEPRTGASDTPGCYVMGVELIGAAPATPLFWHLDAFPTRAAAEAARQSRGTVSEAHGRVWLLTIEGADWRPGGGARVARVGPLPVTAGRAYTAHFFEGVAPPRARTPVHRHPGPEAWYVLEGAPCLETPEGARVMPAGEGFVVPEGPPMMLTGTGTSVRRTLGLVLHDAAQPWNIPASDWTPKESCPR
jgi:hypothetical protein